MKQQFDLSVWLKDKSHKVVTRRGNSVRIICTDRKHGEDILPIVFLEESPDGIGEFLLSCRADGTCDNYNTQYDLFFADEEEEPQSIEIPFGAFDSEFIKDEYLIPEGCEARIEGRKVIIEKIQKEEELTEFEKELNRIVIAFSDAHAYMDKNEIHHYSKGLLDLAKKELQPEIDKKLKEKYDCGYSIGKFDAGEAKVKELVAEFEKGRANALKDLPKWKKAHEHKEFPLHICVIDNGGNTFLDTEVNDDEYYIELEDLKTLPKEE